MNSRLGVASILCFYSLVPVDIPCSNLGLCTEVAERVFAAV